MLLAEIEGNNGFVDVSLLGLCARTRNVDRERPASSPMTFFRFYIRPCEYFNPQSYLLSMKKVYLSTGVPFSLADFVLL